MRESSTRRKAGPRASYGDRVGPALYITLTIDDLVAFNRHVLRTSPLAKRIEETPEYVFVFVGPARALVIPRRDDEAAVRAFVQALTWHRADQGPFVSDWR